MHFRLILQERRAYFKQFTTAQRAKNNFWHLTFFKEISVLTNIFSHSPELSPVPSYKYNCTPKCFESFLWNLSFFTPVFDPHTYKVTTTTAQFTFHNCKWHFTTAEIVISYTLKYALQERIHLATPKYAHAFWGSKLSLVFWCSKTSKLKTKILKPQNVNQLGSHWCEIRSHSFCI